MKERKIDVDNPKEFTVLEWCAGYGGIQLGLRRVIPNLRTIAYSEIEAFACSNLVAKMEEGLLDVAPIWTDLKTFPCRNFHGKVDLLVAGYPCQPFSAAGKRQGEDDPRHLWPHIREAIRIIQPRQCFFENVEGHISLGLSTVLSDLEEYGYCTTWGIFSAEEVGAPHRRKRVFILANRRGMRYRGGSKSEDNHDIEGVQEQKIEQTDRVWSETERQCGVVGKQSWPARPNEPQYDWEPPRVVGDTESKQTGGVCESKPQSDTATTSGKSAKKYRLQRSSVRQTQPPMGRDSDGASGRMGYAELCVSCDNRTDELRLLGNGVVPATVTKAWLVLSERLNNA